MSARILAGIILFCLSISAVILTNLFVTRMIGEINRKRREGDLVSDFGFTFPKMLRIFREYHRLYPDGRLHIYALASFGVAMIGLVIVGVCLHIIG
ncbi:MAG TPA: hypothetical protein VF538_02210 [Pyrinomonadaceae bacterium]